MKMMYLLILMMSTTVSGSVLDFKWKLWKSRYAKSYLNSTEELLRRQIWDTNWKKVMHHNNRADNGKESYWLEMNQFADMTIEELEQDNELMSWDTEGVPVRIQDEVNESVPAEFDWRKKDCVTQVKSQGKCNSCWAFAAVGTIESRLCAKTGHLFTLSEQQLVDCDSGNDGCSPGIRAQAFEYIKTQKGLMKDSDYPYKAMKGRCNFNTRHLVNVVIADIRNVHASDIAKDIFMYGPTSSGIGIMDDFHLYSKGIYSNPACSTAETRHAIIIIGYGPGYWTVKNSWGETWGDNGYFHIKRGVDMCDIEKSVYSPYLQ
ncbi:ervatamin-C-like [Protopterus annectens]|uniref:ervatamin-C-like n=1 Tax=Protopterus annectens TaxID=7888 RepID=UPI001CF9CD19|nr:ervatamin-C-like [Protopterus annectens]XP_043938282.1 ervatamin-C-like [Protopterus annectens]